MSELINTVKKHAQDTRWTLSADIYERLTNKYKENKIKFTRIDFIDLAKKYNKDIAVVSRVLAHLEEKNKISVVGEIQPSRGGWKFKVYQVTSGADFTDKYEPGYRARILNIDKHNTECALRLQAALGIGVRA